MKAVGDRHLLPERLSHTLRTLVFVSFVCSGMLVARFICADDHRSRFSGLFGNLLLAWIPLVLALFICRPSATRTSTRFWSAFVAWVLFFPNAFYLTTDLIHIKKFGTDGIYPWFDMLMTACFACVGMFLGSLSLYLLHLLVHRRFGWRAGWLFATAMLAIGSFGIYLGRFLRLNSWDVLTRPVKLTGEIAGLWEPKSLREVTAFSVTFFFFSLAVYTALVSMARLHEETQHEQFRQDDVR